MWKSYQIRFSCLKFPYNDDLLKRKASAWDVNLHNFSGVPMYGVVVVISSWVEPKVELLLPVSLSLSVDICVDDIRLSRNISQELKIYFIMLAPQRG